MVDLSLGPGQPSRSRAESLRPTSRQARRLLCRTGTHISVGPWDYELRQLPSRGSLKNAGRWGRNAGANDTRYLELREQVLYRRGGCACTSNSNSSRNKKLLTMSSGGTLEGRREVRWPRAGRGRIARRLTANKPFHLSRRKYPF